MGVHLLCITITRHGQSIAAALLAGTQQQQRAAAGMTGHRRQMSVVCHVIA